MLNNHPALSMDFAGLWAMNADHLRRLVSDLHHANTQSIGPVVGTASPSNATTANDGAVAAIPVHGVIMKRVPAVFTMLGIEATGTVETSMAIRAALDDDSVEQIELSIDSPGGSVAGVQQLADLIHEARKIKPIKAVVSDMAASAAYWLASQADTIEANPSALIGSIGVYRVLVDSSKAMDDEGVRVHLIKSGEHKGTGTPGVAISDAQIEEEQRIVDDVAEMFVEAVARGRGLSVDTVSNFATGSTWFADKAQPMGLVDELTTAALPQHGGADMAEEPKVAEVDEAMQAHIEALQLQVQELTGQLSAKSAETAAQAAALASIIETQKLEIINDGVKAGQVVPAMRAKVEDFAAFCGDDVEKLRDFVAALPVQVRATTESEQPAEQERNVVGEISAEDAAVAKLLGIAEEDMKTKSNWRAISAGGSILDDDGKVVGGLN